MNTANNTLQRQLEDALDALETMSGMYNELSEQYRYSENGRAALRAINNFNSSLIDRQNIDYSEMRELLNQMQLRLIDSEMDNVTLVRLVTRLREFIRIGSMVLVEENRRRIIAEEQSRVPSEMELLPEDQPQIEGPPQPLMIEGPKPGPKPTRYERIREQIRGEPQSERRLAANTDSGAIIKTGPNRYKRFRLITGSIHAGAARHMNVSDINSITDVNGEFLDNLSRTLRYTAVSVRMESARGRQIRRLRGTEEPEEKKEEKEEKKKKK